MVHIRFLTSLHFQFERLPPAVRGGAVLLVAGLVTWLDFATPSYVSLHGFYLLPLFLAIWYCGRVVGLLVLADAVATSLYMACQVLPAEAPRWQQAAAYASLAIVFLGFAALIHSLKLLFLRLHLESRTDALTGLRSRRGFFEFAELEIARAARHGADFTVALLDLDNFKHVNDVQGHAAGDALLVAAGRCMAATLRGIDLIGRIGGDEFAILLPGAGAAEAESILGRVMAELRPLLQSSSARVTASIGALAVPHGTPLTITDVLLRADAVMYAVKHESKDSLAVRRLA